MKLFIVCLMVVSHTLAAPGTQKRDFDIYTYHHLPAIRQETTTHYCPEEDIPAKFVPEPPHIQSFPLPSLPNHIVKYDVPIPLPVVPVHHDNFPPPQFHHEYIPQLPTRQEYVEPNEPVVPHDTYGEPFPEYGLPGLPGIRQETPPPPPPEETTLPPPPPETSTLPPPPPEETTTFIPPTEPPTTTTTHKTKWQKIVELKHHLKQHVKQHLIDNIKLPEIQYRTPAFVVSKKVELPFLKNWFNGQQ
ncbi:hypothetical protein ACKWTF_003429 [Chironomus riparius]